MIEIDLSKYLFLIPLAPLAGAAFNGLLGHRMPARVIHGIAISAIGLSFAVSAAALAVLLRAGQNAALTCSMFDWIVSGDVRVGASLVFDRLSAVMALTVTGVSFLIHVYSVGYMHGDRGYWRYFAYLNLFVFAMTMLVLADNLVLMFLGWEGVGLCSYLLIGFWYEDPEKALAGDKAFIVNRIGDFGFLLGILLLFSKTGAFDFVSLKAAAPNLGAAVATAAALLLFAGATGKSAQLPLYVWLPDAMAGPTPVSALIHAATMVTAGVYMVTRMNFLFSLAPVAMWVVAGVGALTAIFSATIGMAQRDIKKVLAYSTVSQLGYMFLACGVGAYAVAMFHLVTHAFFKACLFLGSGSVIHGMHGQQDLFYMGGLRRKMPATFWTFTFATLAIMGFPLTSGFFSKDAILLSAFTYEGGPGFLPFYGKLLWAAGVLTAGITSFYMWRLWFLAFTGEGRMEDAVWEHIHESPANMTWPLVILALLSLIGGALWLPAFFHAPEVLGEFLAPVAATAGHHMSLAAELAPMAVAVGSALLGLAAAWYIYGDGTLDRAAHIARKIRPLHRAAHNKYWVDELYDLLAVKGLFAASDILFGAVDSAVIDAAAVNGTARLAYATGGLLRLVQSGSARRYAVFMVIGLCLLFYYLLGGTL